MMIRTTSLFAIFLISTVFAEESSWLSGDDLAIDLVASHPVVEQPIFLNFDHRGRMWVAQYRQYPFPAGSKVVGKDRFWRSEYDKLPSPPGHPEYVPGERSHKYPRGYQSRWVFRQGLSIFGGAEFLH
jgi:hypothetical protein